MRPATTWEEQPAPPAKPTASSASHRRLHRRAGGGPVKNVMLIAARELQAYFSTFSGYALLAAHLLLSGLLFNIYAVGNRAKFSQKVVEDFFYLASGMAIITALLLAIRIRVRAILYPFVKPGIESGTSARQLALNRNWVYKPRFSLNCPSGL